MGGILLPLLPGAGAKEERTECPETEYPWQRGISHITDSREIEKLKVRNCMIHDLPQPTDSLDLACMLKSSCLFQN